MSIKEILLRYPEAIDTSVMSPSDRIQFEQTMDDLRVAYLASEAELIKSFKRTVLEVVK